VLAGQATAEHFRVNAPDGERWASAVDGTGASVFRHDANDLPTALAPLWGYCAADDPAWLRTIDYAFSPANPDYADGPFGGLGSAHTPGAWALGLIQEWLAYSLAGEPDRAAAALTRLVAAAMADGMLPEASDPATAAATARHWFAWPGAVVGAMLHPPPDGPPRTRNRLLGRSARA
jgi:uncharacterized protein